MQKMKSKKGFTLIEMLIVVGIIAVLVAVSIPMVNSSLEKARVATDAANERAAKAAFMVGYLTDENFDAKKNVYDAAKGTMETSAKGYGKCSDHKDGHIEVTMDEDSQEVKVEWKGCKTEGDGHGINVDAPTPTGS